MIRNVAFAIFILPAAVFSQPVNGHCTSWVITGGISTLGDPGFGCTGATGTGSTVVLSASPALTGTPTAPTQTTGDNTTKLATDAFVTTAIANAVAGINPAVAVNAATTSAGNTSGLTYNNGASGIGATFTGTTNTAIVVDGFTFTTAGQRLLVKNDTQSPSGAFNGIYNVTQIQTSLLPPILTRALDYNQPSNINSTGAIPVVSGTVNGGTSWYLTSSVTTVGTSPLTFAQFTLNPTTILTGTPTTHGVAVGASGQANNYTGAGTAGQALLSNGPSADPSFGAVPAGFPGNYYPTLPAHIPLAATFGTWVNQASATVTDTAAGLYMTFPGGNNNNISAVQKTLPATPYTIDIAVRPVNFQTGGVCDISLTTAAGNATIAEIDAGLFAMASAGTTGVVGVVRWTNFTGGFSANAGINGPLLMGNAAFLRITDDGTTRVISGSSDGTNYLQEVSESHTAYLTASVIGLGGRNNSAAISGETLYGCMWMEYYEH